MCVLSASECGASSKRNLWMDHMVCSPDIVLRSPADVFHLLCSLCASLILPVCRVIARATWVDEWWCPLVNLAPPYMCQRPKEPASWICCPTPPLSSSYLFTTWLLAPTPSFTFSALSPPIHPPYACFSSPQLRSGGRDETISLPLCSHFFLCVCVLDERMGRECQALGWEFCSNKRIGH